MGDKMRVPGLWRTTQAMRSAPAYISGLALKAQTMMTPLRPGTTRHDLGTPLIVSLTSYKPRFKALALTLRRLMSQDTPPDGILLWIAEADAEHLPRSVRQLERFGLRIGTTIDLRSYKKFVPTVSLYPDAFIAIVDDDVAYERTWLGELTSAFNDGRPAVIAHRARRMPPAGDAPYHLWPVEHENSRDDPWLVPTGIGGVLYPPGSLKREALDAGRFQRLAPEGDDLWLFWMARRAGFGCRMVQNIKEPVNWSGSQGVALYHENMRKGGRNDQYISNLRAEFGGPVG